MLNRTFNASARIGLRAKSNLARAVNRAPQLRANTWNENDFLQPFRESGLFAPQARALDNLFSSVMPMMSMMPRFDQLERQVDRAMKQTLGMSDITLDIVEKPTEYTVSAEVPGVSSQNLKVDVDEESGLLTIVAEKRVGDAPTGPAASAAAEKPAETAASTGAANDDAAAAATTVHRAERAYGRIQRTISLPSDVAFDKVSAKLENGVLTLTIPKKAVTESNGRKQIKVEEA